MNTTGALNLMQWRLCEELDLSMNSITSDCLRQLVGWASEPSKASQAQEPKYDRTAALCDLDDL